MADQQQPQQQEMNATGTDGGLNLPPGFRFHPSDDEIVSYLTDKVHNRDFTSTIIAEVDLNKIAPWDLPREAKMGKKEWYFFCKKDRKYPTGLRANRATEAGYWRATGKDKEVYNSKEGVVLLVGLKKTLVFYKGKAPRGDKTDWVMHEYRLEGSGKVPSPTSASSSAANVVSIKSSAPASKDEWVVCRVLDKTTRIKKMNASTYQGAMAGAQIDPNHNISTIPIPMSLQPPQPMPMPMPMQFPIVPDFAMDPVAPYYPNTGTGMPTMMPPMAGIDGTGDLQINNTLFGNPLAALPQMNFYNPMSMGAPAGHMDMGATSAGSFDVAMPESRSSLMVSQNGEQASATEISSMMSMAGPRSATTIEMVDGIWKY